MERLRTGYLNIGGNQIEDGGTVASQMSSRELLELLSRVWSSKAVVFIANDPQNDRISIRVLDHAVPDQPLDRFLDSIQPTKENPDASIFDVALSSMFERARCFYLNVAPAVNVLRAEPVPIAASQVVTPIGEKVNCRTIPPDLWEHARRSLVFYFARRVPSDAEDLAHNALLAFWNRPDYEFDKKEDFLRVCYAFADNISKSAFRDRLRHQAEQLPPNLTGDRGGYGLAQGELTAYLDEVLRTVTHFPVEVADLIRATAGLDGSGVSADHPPLAGNIRVKLHRARQKLAALTSWPKKGR
jgi:hypothetical protein